MIDTPGLEMVEDIYPLSPLQEGILFHALESPGAGVYLQQVTATLEGELDSGALEEAWRRLTERHPVLRTAFAFEAVERPLQVVWRSVHLPFARFDLRELPPARQEERMAEHRRRDRRRGFVLSDAPLSRVALFRTGERAHHLLWTHHHLLLDGWSAALLVRELVTIYATAVERAPARLGSPRPYRDFIAWLAERSPEESAAFWREELAGLPPATALDPESAAAKVSGGELAPGERETRLPADLSALLRERARSYGVTLNTLLQGAWAILLSRYSGTSDVVFGAVTSGRPAELDGCDSMIGLFINTLPARVGVDEEADLAGWLRALQDRQAEARRHEHAPLRQIRSWCGIAGGEPLFETLLDFTSYPETSLGDRVASGGLRIRDFRLSETTNYPLALVAAPGERMMLRAYHDRRRFAETEVRRVLGHLECLLWSMARDGARRVGEIDLLKPAERHQVVWEWGGAGIRHGESADELLYEVFEARAGSAPDAVALVHEGQHVSYGRLADLALRLSSEIARYIERPEERVAIFAERSPETVVAILAVLRTGAAYVPVDPRYPEDRTAFVLADAQVPLVLCPAAERPRLPEGDYRVLDPAAAAGAGPTPSASDAPRPAGGLLAYVIYTSGSTGRPKGVEVSQRNVLRLFRTTEPWFSFGPDDAWSFFHSVAFDFSVWEVWGALLYGGRLVLVSPQVARSPESFHELLDRERVTVLNQTPSAFYLLSRVAERRFGPGLEALRDVVFGGEALEVGRLAWWLQGPPDRRPRLVNMYGITETTVHVTYRPLSSADLELAGRSPIGRALHDLELYVLDRRGRPVPIGVAGELHVGGEGLGRGYLARPALTAERFTPSPFGSRLGERLYRTGDLARLAPDGEVEYLGRIDHQVKIRGHRIELGEVEAALVSHPEVDSAVATRLDDSDGGARLAAYVVMTREDEARAARLRSWLAERLPSYMVPALFVFLAELPLTPSGKVDRRALPRPDAERPELQGEAVGPRSRKESLLEEVWSQVLDLEGLGVHDDFFELGGDSILCIQVVTRARQEGLEVTSRQLFEGHTIANVALVARWSAPPPERPVETAGPVPLTPVQRWFFEQNLDDPHHFNQALMLELAAGSSPSRLGRALGRLIARHDALRLRFRHGPEGWWQRVVPPGGPVPLTVVDLHRVPAGRRRSAIERASGQAQRGFDLGVGPLVRCLLFERGGGSAHLAVLAHHLVVDGVSWRVLLDDLSRELGGEAGSAEPLPPVEVSFGAWARRLQELAAEVRESGEEAYWSSEERRRMAPLPRDLSGGDNRVASARPVVARLEPWETRRLLLETTRSYRATVEELLLTAVAGALGEWSGRDPLLVEMEGYGRDPAAGSGLEAGRTVGWLTTIYPLIFDVGDRREPARAVRSVKDRLRAVPRRGLGYGLLRHGPDPEVAERLRALPRAEVSFNYLGRLDRAFPAGSPLRPGEASTGRPQCPAQRRRYLFEVVAWTGDGQLRVEWTYDRESHEGETAEHLSADVAARLRTLIERGAEGPVSEALVPTDFPLAGLSERSLRALVDTGETAGLEDVYPLSPMQQGMLFHALHEPETGLYVQHLICELRGDLDEEAFERAWYRVLAGHPVLRTSFAWHDLDRPLQVVWSDVDLTVRREDWRDLGEAEVDRRLESMITRDRRKGFDLARPPLFRLLLARTGESRYKFVWTHHHILLDGWSRSRLVSELLASYSALRRGEEPPLSRQASFRDYVASLPNDREAAREFWTRELAGFEKTTELGREQGSGLDGAEAHRHRTRRLDAEVSAALGELARESGLTRNSLTQAAWAVLLARYAGTQDVVFGNIVSGRSGALPGIETVIGLLMNVQPVRARLEPTADLVQWAARHQARQSEARRFEHVPLVEVQGWSEIPAGEPLFESLYLFENFPDAELGLQGELEIGRPRGEGAVSYPMALVIEPETPLLLRVRHDARRFDDALVDQILDEYVGSLETLVRNPRVRIEELLDRSSADTDRLQAEFTEALEG